MCEFENLPQNNFLKTKRAKFDISSCLLLILPLALQFIIWQYFKGPLAPCSLFLFFFPALHLTITSIPIRKREKTGNPFAPLLQKLALIYMFVSSQHVTQSPTMGSGFFCGIERIDLSCSKYKGLGTEKEMLLQEFLSTSCSGNWKGRGTLRYCNCFSHFWGGVYVLWQVIKCYNFTSSGKKKKDSFLSVIYYNLSLLYYILLVRLLCFSALGSVNICFWVKFEAGRFVRHKTRQSDLPWRRRRMTALEIQSISNLMRSGFKASRKWKEPTFAYFMYFSCKLLKTLSLSPMNMPQWV